MATSGTYDWNPPVDEITDEAFERVGIDPATLTARHVRSARRSFSYMFSAWSANGVHLWAVDQQTVDTVTGTAAYNTPAGTIAILEMVVRRSSIDTPVNPMSRDEYLNIPNKTAQGLPNRFYFDRKITTPNFTLWNVPENATDDIIYYRLRQLQDVNLATETVDAPYRWQEAIVSGLAAKLAEKYAPDREGIMRGKASAALKAALTEDRERTPTTIRARYSVSARRR